MGRTVPAKRALATERIAREVGPGPGTLLELGSTGIHAPVLALLGWEITVAEDDPSALARARERAGEVATVVSRGDLGDSRFDVVIGDGRRFLRNGGRLIRS